jgi:hypothetical protein
MRALLGYMICVAAALGCTAVDDPSSEQLAVKKHADASVKPPDAAVTRVDASTAASGQIECYSHYCDRSLGQVCCAQGCSYPYGTTAGTCTTGACGPGFTRWECEVPSNCGAGLLCCQDPSGGNVCAPSCNGLAQYCETGSDCPAAKPYCCNVAGDGGYFRFCSSRGPDPADPTWVCH